MSASSLNRKDARVLQEVFGHPLPHNLKWTDVVSLVNHLGSVLERHDGNDEFTIGTTSEVFKRPHHKDVELEDVVRLRAFLERAIIRPGSSSRVATVFISSSVNASNRLIRTASSVTSSTVRKRITKANEFRSLPNTTNASRNGYKVSM